MPTLVFAWFLLIAPSGPDLGAPLERWYRYSSYARQDECQGQLGVLAEKGTSRPMRAGINPKASRRVVPPSVFATARCVDERALRRAPLEFYWPQAGERPPQGQPDLYWAR